MTDHIIPPVLETGNTIDQFEIVRVLHSGTRSHVYLARDRQTAEQRVLKMPSLNFSEDVEYLDSFAREEWVRRKLAHPQIMKIYAPPPNSNYPQKFAKWQYTSLNSMSPSLQGFPDWIDNVLKKALAPNPVYRYQALSEFQHDLRSPGQDILKSKQFVPLMERNPLRFWQMTSLILLVIVILQSLL